MVDSEQHHDNALEKEQGESPPLSHSPSKDLKPRSPSPSEHDSASDHEEAKPPLEGGAALRKLDSNVEPEFPPLRKVVVIMLALYLSFFLVALDRTIIATAIPQITDDFHSLGDVGWYGSAYMLTGCGFMLLFGRIYTFYSPKVVYLCCIGLFEIGSAVCGAAPNSTTFIVGRAIAGWGSSGVFSGAIIIIVNTVPLHKRPLWQGMVGAIFGIASVMGPLLGGVFTTNVSWRWCFYINLPIGGVAMVILFFILRLPPPKNGGQTLREQLIQLDPIGTALFMPSIICLLLALQWGGTTYPWDSGRIIALLVLFVILISGFITVQFWRKEKGTVPPRIVANRSIASGMWSQFCMGSSMMLMIYYIPIWFQAVKDVSAVKSGIDILPLILGLVFASISAGILVNRIGYYAPFMILNSVLMSIGAGLITTWTPSTGHSKWIGYQALYGFGMGLGMQQASLAAQAVLKRKDVPTGVSLIMFCQQLGGAVFVSVGDNVFTNKLVQGLRSIPNFDPMSVVKFGATEIRQHVPIASLPSVIEEYNHALIVTYQVGLAMAALSIIGSATIEWKNIKPKKGEKGGPPADAESAKPAAQPESDEKMETGGTLEESTYPAAQMKEVEEAMEPNEKNAEKKI